MALNINNKRGDRNLNKNQGSARIIGVQDSRNLDTQNPSISKLDKENNLKKKIIVRFNSIKDNRSVNTPKGNTLSTRSINFSGAFDVSN